MAEWWLCEGIGEHRAALLDGNDILEAAIDRLDNRLRVGERIDARLGEKIGTGAWLSTARGDAILESVPRGLSQGRTVLVEIVREALPEIGRLKPPRARVSEAGEPCAAPSLAERLGCVRHVQPYGTDPIDAAGWSELLEEAATGEIQFRGGALRLSPTPAMTLFDVDGTLPPAELAIAGARASARAIRRHAIGGSIGIDLPTSGSKSARLAAAQAIDEDLPQPFERTAVNGFGFIQIVRPRPRASIPELVRVDPALSAALNLVRIATRGHGARTLIASPAVIDRIIPNWVDMLARAVGGSISLQPTPGVAISGGYVKENAPTR